ncbi:CatB-related O-acetyltransferase [Chryseobacterium binzhouense]|uniref:CatB-related O-acetyltransferase n=1 Tax=Chryseobacterium binzhouense TaxID=2593646 RepID=UPI0035E3E3DE
MSDLSNSYFGRYNMIGKNAVLINSSLQDFSYISDFSVVNGTEIGKYCSIGPNVRIGPGKHPTHTIVSTHPSIYSNPSNLLKNYSKADHFFYEKKVVIGNDVWIGANAVILDGVKIADGAIVGANSVVTTDVEPYAIVIGTPAKIVKYRFTDDEIAFLMNLKWWDKGDEWIRSNIKDLLDIKKVMIKNTL